MVAHFFAARPAPGYHVPMPARLEARGLTVEIPTTSGWVRPVNDVSFSLAEGESLGIVGESGSGKTMLALALMGLLPPGARAKGEALLVRRDATAASNPAVARRAENLLAMPPAEMRAMRGREIAMIFQEPMTALNPVMRVGAQIEEAIRVHEPSARANEIRARALAALDRAAVPQPAVRARQYPHQLSGGLRQRVMIAMALAANPGVLIADEPTTALDVTVQAQILELLAKLRRELRLSLLFITHDLGVVAQIADRVAVMYAGRIVEEGPSAEVLRHPRPSLHGGIAARRSAPHGREIGSDSRRGSSSHRTAVRLLVRTTVQPSHRSMRRCRSRFAHRRRGKRASSRAVYSCLHGWRTPKL